MVRLMMYSYKRKQEDFKIYSCFKIIPRLNPQKTTKWPISRQRKLVEILWTINVYIVRNVWRYQRGSTVIHRKETDNTITTRYQRGYQKSYIEKRQTKQWPQDTKGVIKSHTSKRDRQYNDHKIRKGLSKVLHRKETDNTIPTRYQSCFVQVLL